MARIYLCSVVSLFVLMLAACGGGSDSSSSESGGSDNSSSESSGSGGDVGGSSATVSEADCDELAHIMLQLQLIDAGAVEYEELRTFFNDFEPSEQVEDDFNQVKDNVNKIADALEDAGVASGDEPVGDQIDELQEAFGDISESDQAEASEALTSLEAWRSNGCKP